MEPPPASLEAMVRSRPGSPLPPPERQSTWIWVMLIVIAIAIAAYYLGLQQ